MENFHKRQTSQVSKKYKGSSHCGSNMLSGKVNEKFLVIVTDVIFT